MKTTTTSKIDLYREKLRVAVYYLNYRYNMSKADNYTRPTLQELVANYRRLLQS